MEVGGLDSKGRQFKNAEEMWREQTGDPSKKCDWYKHGVGYWEGVEASVNGVLGGYAQVNEPDIEDCGSGIGRVTKNLLIRYFNEVDLLEPVSHFLDAARENLGHTSSDMHKATNFFCMPLQEFTPDAGRYDVIWVQWCIGHLTDDDFVSFFSRAKAGLKPGGFFVLKENVARTDAGRYDVIWVQWCIGHLTDDDFVSFFSRAKAGLKPGGFFVLKENVARTGFVLDNEDRSITRSDSYFRELFQKCGLHIYQSKDQKGLPEELFAVKMYALTTDSPKRIHRTRSKVKANMPRIIK
ncbi:alpha n-terminal protein methyltransferase 1 [Quercus suber]|uniref:Alpha N-terminal protein methyltransferase 1 n=1 Tax=Quercus suber TaxID=58331 RepID=A0AAW0LIR4_QUESU